QVAQVKVVHEVHRVDEHDVIAGLQCWSDTPRTFRLLAWSASVSSPCASCSGGGARRARTTPTPTSLLQEMRGRGEAVTSTSVRPPKTLRESGAARFRDFSVPWVKN